MGKSATILLKNAHNTLGGTRKSESFENGTGHPTIASLSRNIPLMAKTDKNQLEGQPARIWKDDLDFSLQNHANKKKVRTDSSA